MKRMLFNATHAEELRVAIVDGQKLVDLDLESAIRTEKKGNIYKGIITKVEPSLEACFVDYGSEKQGFLPMKEIYREYFGNYSSKTAISNVKIESAIKEGQEMIVQVDKDERGTKGAALTTFISLAGRFLVLMPNNPKGGGISRRIAGDDRAELRQILANLTVNSKHSLIARTEGIGRNQEELQWDLDFLVKLWDTIEKASTGSKAPFLIYQESNLIVRSIRDHLSDDISEIIVDDQEIYDRAHQFITQVMPKNINKLTLYKDTIPLFSRYQIESQIDSAFNREVTLPSGGSLTIDHTEALISIDVNSARATKGSDIEETALQTNLEAVDETARQLRIRDLGGLIVIDLIDMTISKNQRKVELRLKNALQPDRARVQVGQISRFGLLEMSRQRLRSSISDMNYRICPRCDGMGTIRSVVSASLNLLRIIEDEALKENTEAIQVALPLDMATYLLNEKRHELHQLEARLASRIIIIPSDDLASPHFNINRLRSEELDELSGVSSYQQKVESDRVEADVLDNLKTAKPERARVQLDQINQIAPPNTGKPSSPNSEHQGLLKKIIHAFTGSTTDSTTKTATQKPATDRKRNQQQTTDSENKNTRPRKRTGTTQNKGKNRSTENTGRQNNTARKQNSGQPVRQDSGTRGQQSKPTARPENPRTKTTTTQNTPKTQNTNVSKDSSPENIKPRSPRPPRQPSQTQDKPKTRDTSSRGKPTPGRGRRNTTANQQHQGVIVTPRDVPLDTPDDIGNRKG